jgi:hypothetical protein
VTSTTDDFPSGVRAFTAYEATIGPMLLRPTASRIAGLPSTITTGANSRMQRSVSLFPRPNSTM